MNPVAIAIAVALLSAGTGASETHESTISLSPVDGTNRSNVGRSLSSPHVLVYTARACGLKRSNYSVRSHPVRTQAVLTAALIKLLRAWQLGTPPSSFLERVEIVEGVARIDFSASLKKPLSWASTSCGGTAFTGSLNNTVFQFESVRAVRYSFDGSCAAFQAFFQSSCTEGWGTLTPAEWQQSPPAFM